MEIVRGYEEKLQEGIEEIFWLTAQQSEFESAEERKSYYRRWAGSYLDQYPQWVYTAQEDGRVLGYLLGCPDSYEALKTLDFPGLQIFQEHFEQYPAHLHINVHPEGQGKGIGKKLIEAYCADLARAGIPGVHLITSTTAKNPGFYRRVGFSFERKASSDADTALFMGRELQTDG